MAKKKQQPKKVEESRPLYMLGEKPYSPKAQKNADTWARLTRALQRKGPLTLQQLAEEADYEGRDGAIMPGTFVGYMVRNGHLQPHQESKQ